MTHGLLRNRGSRPNMGDDSTEPFTPGLINGSINPLTSTQAFSKPSVQLVRRTPSQAADQQPEMAYEPTINPPLLTIHLSQPSQHRSLLSFTPPLISCPQKTKSMPSGVAAKPMLVRAEGGLAVLSAVHVLLYGLQR